MLDPVVLVHALAEAAVLEAAVPLTQTDLVAEVVAVGDANALSGI